MDVDDIIGESWDEPDYHPEWARLENARAEAQFPWFREMMERGRAAADEAWSPLL